MSLSDILGSALSGLHAAQAGLRASSNNIANASSPGYARERVSYSPAVTGGHLHGVRVSEPERIADRFLEANVYRRSGDFGRTEVVSSTLDRLQALLGEPGSAGTLSARMDAIGAAAVAMTGPSATEQTARAFTASIEDALGSMSQLRSDLSALRADVATQVRASVDQINALVARIGDLNDSVARLAAAGRSTSGANSQRMSAVEELSGLLQLNVREQPDGRLFIETANGITLVDRRVRQLSFPPGDSVDQPLYPAIAMRFVEPNGDLGAATGELLDSPAVGGKLGGLLQLRDRELPVMTDMLDRLREGVAEAVNAAANASTAVPAPTSLAGGQTGMAAGDRLGFTGAAVFAVLQPNGKLVGSTRIDFAALGPTATIADAVDAINAGLGGTATAIFTDGRLTLTATGANGIAVAQDPSAPSSRAGVGFAHHFGLNDVIASSAGTLVPAGFVAADPHGFAAGQTVELVLRDGSGRVLGTQALAPVAGGSFGDLLNELASGPLAAFGSFALDSRGRLQFTPASAIPGAVLRAPTDSTDRFGTGRGFASLLQVGGSGNVSAEAQLRPDMAGASGRLPLARINTAALPGQQALGPADTRGALGFADALTTPIDVGGGRTLPVGQLAAALLGDAGGEAARAADRFDDAAARREDAIGRRDSFSGVNVDEELAQLVVLQNSYSAAARVMSTATEMYDTLLEMIR